MFRASPPPLQSAVPRLTELTRAFRAVPSRFWLMRSGALCGYRRVPVVVGRPACSSVGSSGLQCRRHRLQIAVKAVTASHDLPRHWTEHVRSWSAAVPLPLPLLVQ